MVDIGYSQKQPPTPRLNPPNAQFWGGFGSLLAVHTTIPMEFLTEKRNITRMLDVNLG